MKIRIVADGKFEYLENDDTTIDIEIDLMDMLQSDWTFDEIITDRFEEINKDGCSCSFNESQNHCECDGYGYEYDYTVVKMECVNE